MLQEQKEDSWAHRRALQIEDAKTRTFEHLLSPTTEIQRRQEQRRNSKGTLETNGESSKHNEPVVVVNGEDHSDLTSVSSSYTRKHTIHPLPMASWRSSSAGKSSLSPAKSSVSPERSQSQAVEKISIDNCDAPNQSLISKRTDFNYNEYVSCIAPKKEHSMYESPSLLLLEADQELLKQSRGSKLVKYESPNLLLLETDQELLKQARESKITNDAPKTVLDFRKSLSPKQDNSLNLHNEVTNIEAPLVNSIKADLISIKSPPDLSENLSTSKNLLDQNYNEIRKLETVEKPSNDNKEKTKFDEKVASSVPHGKRIVITGDQPSNNVSPSAMKKESEEEKSIKNAMNIKEDADDVSKPSNNNKNLVEEEAAERNERKATVEREKSTSIENKNMDRSTNSEKLFEDDDEPALNSINKTSQFPVAKPRKSLQQKSKIRLVNDDVLPSSANASNKIVTPTRDLSPKISAVILEEIKIETIPIINTTILEPKKKLTSPQPKISVVVSSEEKKQPEVEPKMSVVMFERQTSRPTDKAKSPTKKLPVAISKLEKLPEQKVPAKTTKAPGNQTKVDNKKDSSVPVKGSTVEKQKTPELKILQSQAKEKSVEKQKTPERKNVEKQKTPERKNVEKQKTPEKKNVEKQKTPERKNVEKQKTPEGMKVVSGELEPKTTLQSNKLKVINKAQSSEPTVIKVRKQQAPESNTSVQIKISPEKQATTNQQPDSQYLAANQPAKIVNGSTEQRKEVSPSAEFKSLLDHDLLTDDKPLANEVEQLKPELHLVNGVDKIKESSPTVSIGSETKISSGQLVNHAPGTKISVHVLNQTPDKPASEPREFQNYFFMFHFASHKPSKKFYVFRKVNSKTVRSIKTN